MILSPRSLSYLFPIQAVKDILAPTASIPCVIQCPLCHYNDSFLVENDYLGGCWFRCLKCEFNGGPLELAITAGDLTVIAAVDKLIRTSGQWHLRNVITTLEREKYLKYQAIRGKFEELRVLGKRNPVTVFENATDFLYRHGLWSGFQQVNWEEHYCRVFGVVSGKEMRHTVGRTPDTVKPKSNAPVVLIPIEDVPGRLHGFHAVSSYGESILPMWEDSEEGGLAYLSRLEMRQEIVYGISDAAVAATLHHRGLREFNSPIPVVVWNSNTRYSWQYVRARRIVLWNNRKHWDIYNQARKILRARVCQIRWTKEELEQRVKHPTLLLNELNEKSIDWTLALKNDLMDLKENEVHDWLGNLLLKPHEWQQVTVHCTTEERSYLNAFFGDYGKERYAVIGTERVVERDNRWYYETRFGENLLSDAIMRIHNIIHHSPTEKTYMTGHVFYNGETIPFQVEESLLRKNPIEFIRNLVIRTGAGYPVFNKNEGSKFDWVTLAFQLSDMPSIVLDSGRVGWDPKQSRWIFPGFTIGIDGIRKGTTTISNPEMMPAPRTKISPINKTHIENLADLNNPTHASYWAAFAAMMFNMTASMFGRKPSPIGLIGKKSDGAGVIIDTLQTQFGMLEFYLRDKAALSDLVTAQEAHDIPARLTLIDEYVNLMNKWLDDDTPKNTIMVLSPLMAASFSSSMTDWSLINCPKSSGKLQVPGGMLVSILSYLFNNSEMLKGATTPNHFFQFIRNWIRELSGITTSLYRPYMIMDKASALLMHGGFIWKKPYQRLMHLIFIGLKNGILSMDENLGNARASVNLDVQARRVVINIKEVVRRFRQNHIPTVSADELVEILHTGDAIDGSFDHVIGIPVRWDLWEEIRTQWVDSAMNKSLELKLIDA